MGYVYGHGKKSLKKFTVAKVQKIKIIPTVKPFITNSFLVNPKLGNYIRNMHLRFELNFYCN